MAGKKLSVTFDIYPETLEMLRRITKQYELSDDSKTIRCLLDFVSEKEENWDPIFKKIRCRRC